MDSKNFPKQVHKWRLAKWLQLGAIKADQAMYQSLSNALQLIIVTAKRRLISSTFSLYDGIHAWKVSFRSLIHLLIGLPEMRNVGFNAHMSTEEQIFLTEELVVDVIKLQNNFLAINN